jgi:hypothetical protein
MKKMTRDYAVSKVREYAEEAESGNYHDLCSVLNAVADKINHEDTPARYVLIKSVDEYPPDANIIVLDIS